MDKIRRTFIIYNFIRERRVGTKKDIQQKLLQEYGADVNERTITRDVQFLNNELMIPVVFNQKLNRYEYGELTDSLDGLESYIDSFSYRLFTMGLHSEEELRDYIQFDDRFNPEVLQRVNRMLTAIKKKVAVSFEYRKYGEQDVERVEIDPLFVKEYDLNWYVVGKKKDKIRSYGIDRMFELSIHPEVTISHEKEAARQAKEYLSIIGIDNSGEVHTVKLEFSEWVTQYIANNPFHRSQRLLHINKDKKGTFQLEVKINNELLGQLMKWGRHCRVLAPAELKKNYIKELNDMMRLNTVD